MSDPWYDDEALIEALSAMRRIAAEEDDRRRATDAKFGTAQTTIGLVVSLSSGTLALYFFQSTHMDVWRALAVIAFIGELLFFVFAARKVVEAIDPTQYMGRKISGVARLLTSGANQRTLLKDELADLPQIVAHNEDVTNRRLTLYRATIENIWKGLLCAVAVPIIALLPLAVNFVYASSLLPFFRAQTSVAPALPHATGLGTNHSRIPVQPMGKPPRND